MDEINYPPTNASIGTFWDRKISPLTKQTSYNVTELQCEKLKPNTIYPTSISQAYNTICFTPTQDLEELQVSDVNMLLP